MTVLQHNLHQSINEWSDQEKLGTPAGLFFAEEHSAIKQNGIEAAEAKAAVKTTIWSSQWPL